MGQTFPGGVCDDDCSTAYLRPHTGELIAVNLSDGIIRWRLPDAGKPLAASRAHVLTLREEGGQPFLELLDAGSGRVVSRLRAADVPGFERVSQGDALDADLAETPEGPRISWRSERRYHGGASPRLGMAPTSPAAGSVLLETRTGRTRPAPPASAERPRPVLEPVVADPATLAAAGRGDSVFALAERGGELVLEARSRGGSLDWTTPLGGTGSRKPKPLRA